MRRTHAQFYGYATYTVCRWQFLVLINTLNVYIACTMFFLRTGQEKKKHFTIKNEPTGTKAFWSKPYVYRI